MITFENRIVFSDSEEMSTWFYENQDNKEDVFVVYWHSQGDFVITELTGAYVKLAIGFDFTGALDSVIHYYCNNEVFSKKRLDNLTFGYKWHLTPENHSLTFEYENGRIKMLKNDEYFPGLVLLTEKQCQDYQKRFERYNFLEPFYFRLYNFAKAEFNKKGQGSRL